jgi:hypothetical protein
MLYNRVTQRDKYSIDCSPPRDNRISVHDITNEVSNKLTIRGYNVTIIINEIESTPESEIRIDVK